MVKAQGSKLTNTMRDLRQLALKHNIENELYYEDAINMITNLLGDERMTRWLTATCELPKIGKWKWRQMLEFLEKEIKVHQQKAVILTHNLSNSFSLNPIQKHLTQVSICRIF